MAATPINSKPVFALELKSETFRFQNAFRRSLKESYKTPYLSITLQIFESIQMVFNSCVNTQ
jgi:hypothetical protein